MGIKKVKKVLEKKAPLCYIGCVLQSGLLEDTGEAIPITFFCHSSGSWNPRGVRGKFHSPAGYLLSQV